MSTLDDHLLPTFLAQHRLVTMDDITAAGGRATHAAERVRVGRWERVDRGMYRLVGTPQTWSGRRDTSWGVGTRIRGGSAPRRG